MKFYMDRVNDDYETLVVTKKDNRNVVMMSEEAYNNLMINRNLKVQTKDGNPIRSGFE